MNNNKAPFFSIIMPVYNTESFINDSVKSVLNQTFKDYELICVNDCTKDSAFKICQKYAKDDFRIICLDSDKNVGQSLARNKGLEIAKGEYCLFLDSDDTISSDTLEAIYQAIKNTNPDCVVFGYKSIYVSNKEESNLANIPEGLYLANDFYKHILIELNHPFLSCIGTKVYRMSLIKKEKILFNPGYLYNEDLGFSLTSYKKCASFYYINKCFYSYYKREVGSTMSSYKPNMFENIMNARQLYIDLINCNKNDEMLYRKQLAKFYNVMLGGAFDSLKNEKKFSNKDSFKREVEKVKNHPLFKAGYAFVKANKKMIQKKKRLFMYFIARNSNFILWRFVK